MRTRETSNIALLDDHRPPAGRRSKADRAPAVDRLRSPNQLNDSGEASLVGAALGAVGRHAPSVTRSVHIASDSIAWGDGTTRKVRPEMRHC